VADARPLLLADIPWLLYRSFFALPTSIVGARGRPVNALLGTVNALLGVIDARPAARPVRCVVACMGAEEARHRVALYPGYHAHRDPMPAELRWQWRAAGGLLESFGWVFTASEELEADDVMYSYARLEQESGGAALLMTRDRDLYAAVSERVAFLELGKGGRTAELGPAQVRERYGVEPAQVPDFIALRGDPSDGLPGAPGIGAKTAAELLREHGSLEALLELAGGPQGTVAVRSGMRPRVAAALRENAELLLTFKRVATLERIELARPPDRGTDLAGGAAAARKLGMRALSERLERGARART
jgi:5'-3' exonuclease